MCMPSAPNLPPPPPPPPPPPQPTAMKLEAAPGVKEAQQLGARLGTSSLQIPLSTVNVPRG
jgi:hypothetical protein